MLRLWAQRLELGLGGGDEFLLLLHLAPQLPDQAALLQDLIVLYLTHPVCLGPYPQLLVSARGHLTFQLFDLAALLMDLIILHSKHPAGQLLGCPAPGGSSLSGVLLVGAKV